MKAPPLRAVADGALLARFIGDGKPDILALHGWGRDGSDLAPALEGLSALVPDLPGFGASPPPPQIWGAAEYAQGLAPVVAEMSTPLVLVGHSFGGRVAVCLAAQFPDLVRGMVLTGAPLVRVAKPARPRLSYRLIRWANRRGFLSDAHLEKARQRHGSHDYRAARGVMREVLVKVVNESYEQQLDSLSLPVTLLWGPQDHQVPLVQAQAALQHLQTGGCPVQLQVIPGAGHDLPLSHPQVLREAIVGMQEEPRR